VQANHEYLLRRSQTWRELIRQEPSERVDGDVVASLQEQQEPQENPVAGRIGPIDIVPEYATPLSPPRTTAVAAAPSRAASRHAPGWGPRRRYPSPPDMIDKYPAFFWKAVEPYIAEALKRAGYVTDGDLRDSVHAAAGPGDHMAVRSSRSGGSRSELGAGRVPGFEPD